MKVARSLYACVCVCVYAFARCWTVVSICRTVIIDCRIPRDGATLRALNTARGAPPILCTTHTKRERAADTPLCLYILSLLPLHLSPYLSPFSIRHIAVHTCERSSAHAIHCIRSISPRTFPPPPPSPLPRPRSRPILKMAFSSRPFANSLRATRYPRYVNEYRSHRVFIGGICWILIHLLNIDSFRRKFHRRLIVISSI